MEKSIEQILREQIAELTLLLNLKDQRIKELEALRTITGLIWTPPSAVESAQKGDKN